MAEAQADRIAELEAALAERDRRIAELDRRVAELERLIEELRRGGKRQAAPFSKGKPKPDPKRPGRKPGKAYGRQAVRPVPNSPWQKPETARHGPGNPSETSQSSRFQALLGSSKHFCHGLLMKIDERIKVPCPQRL